MPLAAGIGAFVLSAAPTAQRIRERAAEILRDGAYQAALPRGPAPRRLDLPLGPLELLMRILLWTAVAVAAALAVAWLVRRLSRAPSDVEVPETRPAAPAEIGPAEAAESLAAQGRWAEAIHALLIDTIEALSRAARLAPSLTSREIAARVRLPPRAHDALAGLVSAVEISRFGGEPAGEHDYRACRGWFRAFADAHRSAA